MATLLLFNARRKRPVVSLPITAVDGAIQMDSYKENLQRLREFLINYGGDPLSQDNVTLLRSVTETSAVICDLVRDIVFADGDGQYHLIPEGFYNREENE